MSVSQMPLAELLILLEKLANQSLTLWDIPEGSRARLINVSENATYLVEGPGDYKSILRIHRENYHSRRAIECELEWLGALEGSRIVPTPGFYVGKNGSPIQMNVIDGLTEPRLWYCSNLLKARHQMNLVTWLVVFLSLVL